MTETGMATQAARRTLLRCLWLLLLLPGAPVPEVAAQNVLKKEGITVYYPEGMEVAAQKTAGVYPGLLHRCESRLGSRYPRHLELWLCRDHASFNRRIVQLGGGRKPDFVAAVAFPAIDVIVLKAAAWRQGPPDNFRVTFMHEISHCILGDLRRAHRGMVIPRWFDEGVAQWVSEGLYRGDGMRLHQALRNGSWIPFEELDERFPSQEGASELAYAQSESMVRFIAEYNDPGGKRNNLAGILISLSDGSSFDEALREITGLSLEQMEEEWSRGRRSILPFPLRLLPEAMFSFLLIVLSLLAFVTYRVKRARRLAALDQEELATIHKDVDPPDANS